MFLCIDDDGLTLRALRRILGEDCVTTSSLEEAKSLARESQPELIIIDPDMGTWDGIEAIPDLLRASPKSKVVVFTGTTVGADRRRALQAGAATYVHKIHISRIEEILEEVMLSGRRREGGRLSLH